MEELFVGKPMVMPYSNSVCPLAKCGQPLLPTHSVVRWPCGHAFHLDCVLDVIADKDGPYCDCCDYLEQESNPKARRRRWKRAERGATEQERETYKIVQLYSLAEAVQRGSRTLEDLQRLGFTYEHLRDKHAWPLPELYKTTKIRDPVLMHTKLQMPLSFLTMLGYSASQLKSMGYTTQNMARLGLNAPIARAFRFSDQEWVAHFGVMPQSLRSLRAGISAASAGAGGGGGRGSNIAHVNVIPASLALQQIDARKRP